MTDQAEKLLTKKEIAKFLSISTRQVDRLKIPHIRVGLVKRYEPTQVLLFFKDHE